MLWVSPYIRDALASCPLFDLLYRVLLLTSAVGLILQEFTARIAADLRQRSAVVYYCVPSVYWWHGCDKSHRQGSIVCLSPRSARRGAIYYRPVFCSLAETHRAYRLGAVVVFAILYATPTG